MLKTESQFERHTVGEEEKQLGRHHLIEAEVTEEVIGAAIDVHRELGPGLLESAYQICMCRELALRGISYKSQVDLPIHYRVFNLIAGTELIS